jgi:hypothetical protein
MPINPATQEAKVRKVKVQGQPRQKVRETPTQQISWAQWHISSVPAMWEAMGRRISVQVSPRRNNTSPYLKNN